ncbi:hypothetical protein AAG906_033122 [Vitis piasezkii]
MNTATCGETQNHKVIGVKWVFKTKLNPDGSICNHKSRLVTFALVARYDTIQLLFIYVEQPDGVVAPGKEDYVYLLRKALYGLKQAPKAWYETMDKHLTKLGFIRSQSEATLYVKTDDVQLLIISLYVDNMLVIGNHHEVFLGMEVMQSCSRIFICQQKYPVSTPMTTNEKLSKDDGFDKIDEGLYRSLIGSLLYLTTSRSNILFVVSVLSKFMHSPSEKHFLAAKRVLRYIKRTIALGVQFSKSAKVI